MWRVETVGMDGRWAVDYSDDFAKDEAELKDKIMSQGKCKILKIDKNDEPLDCTSRYLVKVEL